MRGRLKAKQQETLCIEAASNDPHTEEIVLGLYSKWLTDIKVNLLATDDLATHASDSTKRKRKRSKV